MAQPQLAPGKKRYSVSLNVATVERFQGLVKDLHLGITVSDLVEDTLLKTSDLFQQAKDQGSLSLSDLFTLVGKQMDLPDEKGGKPNDKNGEKAKSGKKDVKRGA